jgi:branched-chain amino acid aminotransferase
MLSVWVNDRLVPEAEAVVSVFDHGFLYGDGIYETLLARDCVILKLKEHFARLKKSASLIQLRLPMSDDEFKSILYRTVDDNTLTDAYIRVTVSRGPGPIGLDPALSPSPSLIVIARLFVPYPGDLYRKGVKITLAKTRRNLREAINPAIKSLNFLNNVLAKIEAKKRNAFEAVMLNDKGFVAEGTITNIFMVKNRVLLTPSLETGILSGITRQTLLRLAGKNGIRTVEKLMRPADLYRADEVFITNTTLGVMPVAKADGVTYKEKIVTSFLAEAYEKEMQKEIGKGRR